MAETKLKTKSIFDFLNCLFVTKTKWDDLSEMDKKAFSPYMINRFISMHPEYISIVNYLQQYTISGMNPREVYKLYLDLLPKQKFFAKYIKAKNDDSEKFSPKLIEFLARQEQWSQDETINNLSFITLTSEGNSILKDYLKLYGISSDEVKKVYKIA
jgi:hypothetical protein